MDKKTIKTFSQILMLTSLVAVIFSGISYLGSDVWLASTQWLLVAAVLALFGVYARLES